jgi:hypothetical protein
MKLKLEIEIEVEDMDRGELDWFKENVLTKDLILHSNEIGDTIGNVTAIKSLKVRTDKP